jgi:hypothetical protein
MFAVPINERWQVRLTRAELPSPTDPLPWVRGLPAGWREWIGREDIPPGTPFLISPSYEYDVTLNSFFLQAEMICSAACAGGGWVG